MSLTLTPVTTEEQWHAYHSIRRAVLWDARGRTNYDDRYGDEYLPNNHPLLLHVDGKSIGTTRLDDNGDGTAIVRLVAIAIDQQRRGYGRHMSEMVSDFARQLGADTLFVNAAPDAVGFYTKTGWTRFTWDERELVSPAADCVQMRKFVTE